MMIAPPFFPRGSGPLVSILIPTRGRPKSLWETVDSFSSMAKDKSNLEFIFKVDDDDRDTIDATHRIFSSGLGSKILTSPRGRGYLDMHVFVNQMCEVATGDWLLLINDDARMTKEGWDYEIMETGCHRVWPGMDELCLLHFPTMGSPHNREFFALRKRTYDLLNHFSLSTYCDHWIDSVMKFCGCVIEMEISIEHRNDPIEHRSVSEEDEENRKIGLNDINSLENMRLKVIDINKVLGRIEWYESRRVWTREPPKQYGWMLWRREERDYPKVVYVSGSGQVVMFGGGGNYLSKVAEIGGFWTIKE